MLLFAGPDADEKVAALSSPVLVAAEAVFAAAAVSTVAFAVVAAAVFAVILIRAVSTAASPKAKLTKEMMVRWEKKKRKRRKKRKRTKRRRKRRRENKRIHLLGREKATVMASTVMTERMKGAPAGPIAPKERSCITVAEGEEGGLSRLLGNALANVSIRRQAGRLRSDADSYLLLITATLGKPTRSRRNRRNTKQGGCTVLKSRGLRRRFLAYLHPASRSSVYSADPQLEHEI